MHGLVVVRLLGIDDLIINLRWFSVCGLVCVGFLWTLDEEEEDHKVEAHMQLWMNCNQHLLL